MNAAGWTIFILANGTVIALIVYCFIKVFSMPREHMQAPIRIETGESEKFEDCPPNPNDSEPKE